MRTVGVADMRLQVTAPYVPSRSSFAVTEWRRSGAAAVGARDALIAKAIVCFQPPSCGSDRQLRVPASDAAPGNRAE